MPLSSWRMNAARARTLLLIAGVTEDDLLRQHDTLMGPIMWDLGHISHFEELWLLSNLEGEIRFGEMPGMFNPFEHPRSTRGALPLPALVNKRAGAIATAPYACESLAWLNSGAAQAQAALGNPALYTVAPVFRGFHAILEEFALDAQMQPTAVAGALVIGSPNPRSLVAMAATVLPQLATLELKPDGAVKPLELPPLPNLPSIPAWVAMTDQLLGVGFGTGADARLPGYLQSDPEHQPLLLMGYSGRMYETLADIILQGAAAQQDPQLREEMERQAMLMREVYAAWIEHASMRIEFTEHGVEMLQDMRTR